MQPCSQPLVDSTQKSSSWFPTLSQHVAHVPVAAAANMLSMCSVQAAVLRLAFKQAPNKRTAPLEAQAVHVFTFLRQVQQLPRSLTGCMDWVPQHVTVQFQDGRVLMSRCQMWPPSELQSGFRAQGLR